MIINPTLVAVNSPVTVNRIEFNSVVPYAIGGLASVNLEADSGGGLPSIAVQAGTHQFQAQVNLQATTDVDVVSDATLIYNNALNLNGNTLNKMGDGEMAIRNVLVTAGGTINVQGGIISGNGTVGGDLINNAGTISPGNSPGVLAAVPEPTSLALLLIGALGLPFLRRGNRA